MIVSHSRNNELGRKSEGRRDDFERDYEDQSHHTRSCRHVDRFSFENMLTCLSCGMTFIRNAIQHIPAANKGNEELDFGATGRPVSQYPYRPLSLREDFREIRLLVLFPGQVGEDLRGQIIHARLSDKPRYEALSYTWADESGSKAASKKIQCNDGCSIGITTNCAAALNCLRRQRRKRLLWIDAICIDQSNTKERNHQVAHLRDIFQASVQVVIYLGETADNSDRFLEYITADVPGALPDTRAVAYFFARRWFHRMWILQEIATARQATIYCGASVIRWKNFTLLEAFLQDLGTIGNRLHLPSTFQFNQPFSPRTILELLDISRHCAATDPRDNIYALLGLATDVKELCLPVDYSKTASDLFYDFASNWIRSYRSLEILSYHVGQDAKDGMPSWVPDWSIDSPLTTIQQSDRDLEMPTSVSIGLDFSDSIPRLEQLPSSLSKAVLITRGRLCVEARRIGTVSTTLRPFQPSQFCEEIEKRLSACRQRDQRRSISRKYELRGWKECFESQEKVKCPKKQFFWEELTRGIRGFPSQLQSWLHHHFIENLPVYSEVPPAFGGSTLCRRCQDLEIFHWSWYHHLARTNHYQRCMCTGMGLNSSHYDEKELGAFLSQLNEHGANRKLFTTEYSLGFGPEGAKDGDMVWLLDGAKSPMILRRASEQDYEYTFVGPCYVHAAQRLYDVCSLCESTNRRICGELVSSTEHGLSDSLFLSPWRRITIV